MVVIGFIEYIFDIWNVLLNITKDCDLIKYVYRLFVLRVSK